MQVTFIMHCKLHLALDLVLVNGYMVFVRSIGDEMWFSADKSFHYNYPLHLPPPSSEMS